MTKKLSGKIAITSVERNDLYLKIENIDGVHVHVRNAEKFRGNQKNCPLCKNGSQFEKAMGPIGT